MQPTQKARQGAGLETLAVIALFCFAAGLISHKVYLSYLGLGCLFTGLFLKKPANALAGHWLKLSEILGKINSRVILTLIFYAFLTPISFIYRMFNKDPLGCVRKKQGESYWTKKDVRYAPGDLEKMW